MSKFHLYRFPILILVLIFLFSLTVVSQNLIKNSSDTQEVQTKPTVLNESTSGNVEVTEGNASAEVKVENKVNSSQSNVSETGTCKVTRNGVTEIVPADQVNVNEKSNGDINVKVECDNTTSSNNGNSSSKTSIKNDVKVNVNTSN